MTAIFVIALALLTFTLFFVALRSRRKHAIRRGILPLDVSAFQALIAREDEVFLRERLSRGEFSRIKRRRIRVTWKYVNRISDNAAVVLHMAGLARLDGDPNVIGAAAQLADLATEIRLQCLKAFVKLAAEYAVPSLQLNPAMLAPQYKSLQQTLARLRALNPQNVPALVSV